MQITTARGKFRRCRGCGHLIRKGDRMATVHRWDNELRQRIATTRFHEWCQPDPDDEMVNLLTHPGFEYTESFFNGKISGVRLEPVRAEEVVDMVTKRVLSSYLHRPSIFQCYATREMEGRWRTTIQGGGPGSRRYEYFDNEEAAMTKLKDWYWRRFRSVEVVT